MTRAHRCSLVILTLVAVSGILPAQAQAPPAKPPKQGSLEVRELTREYEHKLLAQLVEYLHCDTFPPPGKDDADVKAMSSGQVKTFVEMRRKTIGNVRTRLRDIKAESEIYALYDDYLSLLDQADKFGDKQREAEDKYFKGIKAIRDKFKVQAQISMILGEARKLDVTASSIGRLYSWDPYQNTRGLLAGLHVSGLRVMSADLKTYANILSIMQKYKDKVQEYEEKNLPILKRDLASNDAKFRDELNSLRGKVLDKSTMNVAKLTSTFQWVNGEVSMDPFGQLATGESKNPFQSLAQLNRVTEVKSMKQAEECEKLAEKLLSIAGAFPKASNDSSASVYRRLQADLSFLAGMHANRAAEFELGAAGFGACVKSPVSAGNIAVRAFKQYDEAHVPIHAKTIVKRQMGLAYAYDGKTSAAFNQVNDILDKDLAGIDDPQFFYDCARLRCLGGNDSIPVSWRYLRSAALLGYRNVEQARSTPDLEMLRKNNKKLFEQMLDATK